MIVRLEDACVVATNPGLHEVSGRGNDKIKGHTVRELNLFDTESAFERILGVLRRGDSVVKEILTMVSYTQGKRTMQVSAKPIELAVGPCGIFTFADVTELKQAEEAARRSGNRFARAFALAPIPAVMSTLEGSETFTEVNEAFLTFLGYAREEVIGKTVLELKLWSSREDRRKLQEAQENDRFKGLEVHVRDKLGNVYDVLLSTEVLQFDEEQSYLRMFYDVTDRKRSEGQMRQAVQSLMNDTSWFSQELIARLNHLRGSSDIGSYQPLEGVTFTSRERQVLECLARGWDNGRIGEEMGLKMQTVRNYISTIYEKLDVHSRAEALIWAREHGFTGQ